jgi:choline/glycine/proline betaine transport protein
MLVERHGFKINPYVFFPSAGLILLFVILGVSFPRRAEAAFSTVQTFIVDNFGWFYILSVAIFLGFTIWLAFSRYANIKLGPDDAEPDYSFGTWLAMLFSAGMGIGLIFFSVAEPMLHFIDPRSGEPQSIDAARRALNLTFFHWGLHAWAIYVVVGLSLAYVAHRHRLPLTIRSALYPLFGERIYGAIGNAVDTFAVFGTLFGLATSLGFGAMQINAGLAHLGILPASTLNQLILIGVITGLATASAVSGLDRGIKVLSELNMVFGLLLLAFVFVLGPTVFLLSSLVQSIGYYLQNLVGTTFRTDAFIGTKWQGSWTMFYWGWWIAWSPFVGMFIARISRGRTIRQFITGVLLVPTLLTFIWLTVFGNTALHIELFGAGGIAEIVQQNVPVALFVLLEQLPWATATSVLAMIVIATFFVTSADSGALVIDILTAEGDLKTPVKQRFFWAVTAGAVAAALLLSGGLLALQTAAITMALPFCAIMLLMCYSLLTGLRAEAGVLEAPAGAKEE